MSQRFGESEDMSGPSRQGVSGLRAMESADSKRCQLKSEEKRHGKKLEGRELREKKLGRTCGGTETCRRFFHHSLSRIAVPHSNKGRT